MIVWPTNKLEPSSFCSKTDSTIHMFSKCRQDQGNCVLQSGQISHPSQPWSTDTHWHTLAARLGLPAWVVCSVLVCSVFWINPPSSFWNYYYFSKIKPAATRDRKNTTSLSYYAIRPVSRWDVRRHYKWHAYQSEVWLSFAIVSTSFYCARQICRSNGMRLCRVVSWWWTPSRFHIRGLGVGDFTSKIWALNCVCIRRQGSLENI